MKGRKPKPTALKIVTGNPGRRKLPKREPKPKRVIPSPPEHLGDEARVAWGAIAARLDRVGVLTELDGLALEQLCENYVEILEHRKTLEAEGRTQAVTTQSGGAMIRAHPAQAQLADAEKRFRAMLAEFGMTPSARSRVSTETDDNASVDPAQKYFA